MLTLTKYIKRSSYVIEKERYKNVIPNKISVGDCDFTVRTFNCLKRAGIKILGDITSIEQLKNTVLSYRIVRNNNEFDKEV